jgi:parallel beta-helix repeat protein
MKKGIITSFVLLFLFGSSIVVIDFSSENAMAGTPKSGTILTDETWVFAGSPYWIEGNVNIASGATLTIEPGVEVKFNGFYSFNVDGNLAVIGTETNRTTLTSNSTTPYHNDWDTIYVNSTGHIEIKYCDISYGRNALYLTSSGNVITNNNILNNGKTVFPKGIGILLIYSSNNTIANNNISNNGGGIVLTSSSNNTISGNNVSNNWGAMSMWLSSNNLLTNNSMSNNSDGIELLSSLNITIADNHFVKEGVHIWGDQISHFNSHQIPDGNFVNGKPLYYFKDSSGLQITGVPVGQIILANYTDVDIKDLEMNDTDVGVEAAYSTNINIANISAVGNDYGIHLFSSSNISMIDNEVTSNSWYGVFLDSSSGNTIMNSNVLSSLGDGIYLGLSSNNTLSDNNISSNGGWGITLAGSSDNTITSNWLALNQWDGIRITSFSNNRIYHNNFIDNLDESIRNPCAPGS